MYQPAKSDEIFLKVGTPKVHPLIQRARGAPDTMCHHKIFIIICIFANKNVHYMYIFIESTYFVLMLYESLTNSIKSFGTIQIRLV